MQFCYGKILANSYRGSEQVPVGTKILENRSIDDVGRFLSVLRLESRGTLIEFGIEIDAEL